MRNHLSNDLGTRESNLSINSLKNSPSNVSRVNIKLYSQKNAGQREIQLTSMELL